MLLASGVLLAWWLPPVLAVLGWVLPGPVTLLLIGALAAGVSLFLGTMVGWKRVVKTIGEKIGKQGMTYAQGMAEIGRASCRERV